MDIVKDLENKRETLYKELLDYTEKIEKIKEDILRIDGALKTLTKPNIKYAFKKGELKRMVLNHLGDFTLRMICEEIATLKHIENPERKYRLSRTLAVIVHKLCKDGLLEKKKERGLVTTYSNPNHN